MSRITGRLGDAFLRPFASHVTWHSDPSTKPLSVDLRHPYPSRLRAYLYTLVGGDGERSRREFKVVLRVAGQPVGEYGQFDHSGGRFTTIVGYDASLDVFVLWDASLHPRFKNGGNLQVKDDVVRTAAALGHARQIRHLSTGERELVIACQSSTLPMALNARVLATGGVDE